MKQPVWNLLKTSNTKLQPERLFDRNAACIVEASGEETLETFEIPETLGETIQAKAIV